MIVKFKRITTINFQQMMTTICSACVFMADFRHKGERQGWLVGGRGGLWVGGWWFISVCWPSVVSALQKLGHIGEQLLDGGNTKKN